jgi:hypothetical protein
MVTLLLLLATANGPQAHSQGPFPTMALCSAAAERAVLAGVAGQRVLRAECAKE